MSVRPPRKSTPLPVRRIHIRKETFKFAAGHMTIFEDGSKEALHGHNYTAELTLEFVPSVHAPMVPFAALKTPLKTICAQWDEKVLLPIKSRFFKLRKQDPKETEFLLCNRRYVLPSDEIVCLRLDNITAESLAEELCRRYLKKFSKDFLQKTFQSIQIRVDESPGQGASFTWSP